MTDTLRRPVRRSAEAKFSRVRFRKSRRPGGEPNVAALLILPARGERYAGSLAAANRRSFGLVSFGRSHTLTTCSGFLPVWFLISPSSPTLQT